MSTRSWFRAPRNWLVVFLAVSLAPSCLLVWLGWRLFEQDRELDRQRGQEQRERAADLMVAGLEQSLAAAEQRLADPSLARDRSAAEDVVFVTFGPRGAEAWPKGRLLYYPVIPLRREALAHGFVRCQELEFQRNDPVKARDCYQELAREGPDRARAWIGMARNLRKAGRSDDALAAFGEAARLGGAISVEGAPVELVARWARCDLLEEMNRTAELRVEADALAADLKRVRWPLQRAVYEFHTQELSRWRLTPGKPDEEGSALAAGVEWLWKKWRTLPSEERQSSGRQCVPIEGGAVTILWRGAAEQLTGLVAGPRFVEREWMARLAPRMQSQGVRVSIHDPGGPGSNLPQTRRSASDTGLPWTLVVESVGQDGQGWLAARRRLLLAGLALLAALVSAGGYFISRAVGRELAVARLQSHFVAAVSHEFRTPLTTLCQLTEILGESRVSSEERRQTYYQALGRQAHRLRRLVEGLLDFGRMEAGVAWYRPAPLDVVELVRSVVEEFGREAADSGYRINLTAGPEVLPAEADREALGRALWNLLDNATKYSPDREAICVEVVRESNQAEIRVRDRGLGIPLREQKEIFGKFVRGAAARAANIKGTGIGLAMVDHILRAHGGSVRVESEPGQGSTFTLQLPCALGLGG